MGQYLLEPLVQLSDSYWCVPCVHLCGIFDAVFDQRNNIVAPSCIDRLSVINPYLSYGHQSRDEEGGSFDGGGSCSRRSPCLVIPIARPHFVGRVDSPNAVSSRDGVDVVLQAAVETERLEREAVVRELCGDEPGCAIVQWPGRWSGNRQWVAIVHDTSHVRHGTVGCVLIGKAIEGPRPCSCFEHPTSQARGSCIHKRKMMQLWQIESTLAENSADGSALTDGELLGASDGKVSDVRRNEAFYIAIISTFYTHCRVQALLVSSIARLSGNPAFCGRLSGIPVM